MIWDKFFDAMKELFMNEVCRYLVIAGCSRYWAGYSIGFFMPKFFGGVYPSYYVKYYSTMNAAVVSLCGLASSVGGGIISDYFDKKGYHVSKAMVCFVGTALGIPTIILCTCVQNNFWISMTGLALEYLFAECWIGPTITMILGVVSNKNKGFAVGAFLFFASIFGMIATSVMGSISEKQDTKTHPSRAGYILVISVCCGYGLSLPFFLIAGWKFRALKLKEAREKAAEEERLKEE